MAQVDWIKVRDAFDTFMLDNASDAQVTLRGTATTFSIKAAEKHRAPQDLTQGINQNQYSVSVMANRWDTEAGAGRPPQKGDQIVLNGRRRLVESAGLVATDGVKIGYILRLKG